MTSDSPDSSASSEFVKEPDRGGQPAPIPNGNMPVHFILIQEIRKRWELGIERYGTPLQAGNGRDALQDAIDEILDCAVYLIQLREERDA